MTSPVSLVPKTKPSDAVQADIVAILERTLAEAKAGELQMLWLIAEYTDGGWRPVASKTTKVSETIGRIEIAKQELIANFLKAG